MEIHPKSSFSAAHFFCLKFLIGLIFAPLSVRQPTSNDIFSPFFFSTLRPSPDRHRIAAMQKRDQSKAGGGAGGSATPAAKRGRPFGSGIGNAATAAGAAGSADSAAPSTLLGPSLQVHSAFAGQSTHG